jgi:hypothetical protein
MDSKLVDILVPEKLVEGLLLSDELIFGSYPA